MKKKPYPTFFSNIPNKEIDKLLKDDEVKPMKEKKDKTPDEKETASKKSLSAEDIARMIKEWDDKTTAEWAKEFEVSYQTILKMAEAIRKEDKTLCPQKPKKARTRADIAKAGIALFKKKQGKK